MFIVVAIVIFGIFVSLSYTLFGKTLQPQVISLFETATNINKSTSDGEILAFTSDKEINNKNDLYKPENEFMQYADLSPTFNEFGEGTYRLELEIKTNIDGEIQIYTQNGEDTQYYIGHSYVQSSNAYTKHSFKINVVKSDRDVKTSMLAFYGKYGTGVFATVKNVRLYKVLDTQK